MADDTNDLMLLRQSYVLGLVEQNTILHAEVERLRAAGDALYRHLDAHYGLGNPMPYEIIKALGEWQEARRG